MILQVNDQNFNDELINKHADKLILIDFWAPWCGPCQSFTPILEEFAKKHNENSHLVITKFNVDEGKNIPAQYGIRSIPTLVLIKNSQVLDTKVGLVNAEVLAEFVLNHLK